MGGKFAYKKKQTFFERYRCPITSLGIILIALLIFYSRCPPKSTPIITVEDGQLVGIVQYSRNGTEYWSFRGIPFAQPPVGKLRFTPPIPNKPWRGVWKAVKFSPHCLQFDAMIFHTVYGSEDCLYLNVFSPPIKSSGDLRPVLVYIHGGGFMSGGAAYHHPTYFMDNNVVLISFNYRIGPLGFLNLAESSDEDNNFLGNMGMKDQRLLFQWVQKNIEKFGGDPSRVTIYGQSAGAASVHAHVLSPQSKGLFRRAITQSGTSFCPWAFSSKANEISQKLVEKLNCPTNDSQLLLECLQNYDGSELVKHQVAMVDPRVDKDLHAISIETIQTQDTFISSHPRSLLKSGNFSSVPFLFGVNSGEGAFRVARFDAIPGMEAEYNANFSQLIGKFLGFDNLSSEIGDKIRDHYFGNLSFTKDPLTFKRILSKVGSDAALYEQVNNAAVTHARSGAPTFLFFNNYRPRFVPSMYSAYRAVPLNDWLPARIRIQFVIAIDLVNEFFLGKDSTRDHYGISHGDDIPIAWNVEGESYLYTYWDTEFSESYVQLMVNFTTSEEVDFSSFSYKGVDWPPINVSAVDNGEKVQYMLLDNKEKPTVIEEPFTESIQFWRDLGIDNF